MGKRIMMLILTLAMVFSASACNAGNDGVNVQRADQLAASGKAGERYAGMVVSENVEEIQRDSSKNILELYVSVGDKVKAGDKLFTYDSAALELDLEKNQLEIEKMKNEKVTYEEQLAKLEKQLKRTYNESAKVRLTLEINTLKTTILENEYKMAAKEDETVKLQNMLENIDITASVDGTVRKISQEGEGPYITIQQSGAYRIKGSLNEMSMQNGLMMGSRVRIYSRVDPKATWMGTVANIDLEGGSQDNNRNDMMMGGMIQDGMSGSSSYPFYVDLDSTDGLLLGQHVYMEVVMEEGMPGLWIPQTYLADILMNEETGEMTATVFADNGKGKLEKRTVTLGMQDGMSGCYEILTGLAPEDYVADPAAPGCEAGATVLRRTAEDFNIPETTSQAPDAAEDGEMIPEESMEELPAEGEDIPNDSETLPADGEAEENVTAPEESSETTEASESSESVG